MIDLELIAKKVILLEETKTELSKYSPPPTLISHYEGMIYAYEKILRGEYNKQ